MFAWMFDKCIEMFPYLAEISLNSRDVDEIWQTTAEIRRILPIIHLPVFHESRRILPKVAEFLMSEENEFCRNSTYCAGSKPTEYSRHRATCHVLPLSADNCELAPYVICPAVWISSRTDSEPQGFCFTTSQRFFKNLSTCALQI